MEYRWNVSPKEARILQESLQDKIIEAPLPGPITKIAGVDVSFNRYERDVYAGIIVLSYPDLSTIEYSVIQIEVTFPYIPGFLSFREIPPLIEAWKKIRNKPDVLIVDGHGIAHPRRLGIATHLGLVLDLPTIGVAKKKLYGDFKMPENKLGAKEVLYDPKTREVLGTVLRSRENARPIFISPGNRATIRDAYEIITKTIKGYKLPEPTRLAHKLVNEYRRGELEETHKLYEDDRRNLSRL